MKALLTILLLAAVPGQLGSGSQCCPNGLCPAPSRQSPWQATRPIAPRRTAPPPKSRADPFGNNVVRIEVHDPRGTGCGSGSLIASKGGSSWVLTCSHLFDEPDFSAVVVRIEGVGHYQAKLVKRDTLWDLALLRIADPGVRPAAIASRAPSQGERLLLGGFGYAGREFRWMTGPLAGWGAPGTPADGHPMQLLRVSLAVRGGDSGGPILNAQRQLVGVIAYSNKKPTDPVTLGAGWECIRAFLAAGLAEKKPKPQAPGPVTPSPNAEVAALTAELAAIKKRLKALEEKPDPLFFWAGVRTRLEEVERKAALPFYIRRINNDTGEESEPIAVHLGEAFTLRLWPHVDVMQPNTE